MMTECFNPEPIMLRNATSAMSDDKLQTGHYLQESDTNDSMIEIAQHLAPEQFKYEFPPKAHLIAIAEQEQNDHYSFFDESSFTTTSTFSTLMDHNHEYRMHTPDIHNTDRVDRYFGSYDESWQQRTFVADSQLSPLQLPTQASRRYEHDRHGREESYDSTSTIILPKKLSDDSVVLSSHRHFLVVEEDDRINWDETPFTFPDYNHPWSSKVYRSVHPYHCRLDSEDDIECPRFHNDSYSQSSHSRVVVMKLSRNSQNSSTVVQFSHNYTGCGSDEGYDDEEDYECKEIPISSTSVYIPLSKDEEEQLICMDSLRNAAAIKIQSVWRGYCCRKDNARNKTTITTGVLAGLARINDSIHRRNNNQLHDRLYVIEQRMSEETRMRIAFEKAMEEMTNLMDNQHKVLYERLEQEVDMRQAYERKMEQAISQIQPLEARLRHESKARADLESMMSRVLDQLHEVKQKAKEDTDARKLLQRKLDSALEEVDSLKKSNTMMNRPLGRSATAMSTTRSRMTATPTKALPPRSTTPTKASPVRSTVTRAVTPNKVPVTNSKRTLTPSRLSPNNRVDPVTNKKNAAQTPSSLRKTVINRKL